MTNITFGSSITIGDFKGIVVASLIHSEPDISVQSLRFAPLYTWHWAAFQKQDSINNYSGITNTFVRFHTPEIADQFES